MRVLSRWLAVVLVGVLAGLLASALVPQSYSAKSVLAVPQGRGSATADDSPSAAAAILGSADLAQEVVKRLGSDWTDQASGPSLLRPLTRYLPTSLTAHLISIGLLSPLPSATGAEMEAVDAYRRALYLEPRDGAGVLIVGFSAASAPVAARAANLATQVYLERRAVAVAERDQALATAAESVRQAQEALGHAIDRAAAFRNDPAASDTARRARAAEADLSLLLAERAALVGERDAIARRLLSVENLRGSGDPFDAPFEGVNLLRHLVEQRLTLRAELAAERRIRAARHWRVRALAAQAEDLDSQITAATGSAYDWLTSERTHLEQRIAGVETAIHLRQAIIAAAADNDRRQNDLDRTVDAARDRLVLTREQLRDEQERVRADTSSARILTIADIPAHSDPARPLIAGIITALLSGFAAWRLLGPGRGESPQRAEAGASGAPPTGLSASATPAVSADDRSSVTRVVPLGGAADTPLVSVRMEGAGERALEALLARLAITPRTDGGRHLAVVATEDGRAAAAIARALGQHLARRERVVLLDLVNPGTAAGFTDLISGTASFAEIITREPGSRLHYVARGHTAIPDDHLGDTVQLALSALDQTYDWIIEITPIGGRGGLAERLLDRAHGVVLIAAGDALDVKEFEVYEALREKGIDNIAVGLAGGL